MNKKKIKQVESLLSEAKQSLNDAVSDDEELENSVCREKYLSEFENVCNKFDINVEIEEDDRGKDEVYSEWNDTVNVSASELQKWSRNPCSRQASKDPEAVIKRNLRLLDKNKEDWTSNDVEDAKRTISFVNRMNSEEMRPDSPREGPHGCPSEWAISLLNWAYNPFDSIPTPDEQVQEKLDPVEQVSLQERKNIKEAEQLAEHAWVMKDILGEFSREFESQAMKLEETKTEGEVEDIRSALSESIDLMMEKIDEPVNAIKSEELRDSGPQGYEFEPIPDQVLYAEDSDARQRASDLGLEGTHEHPVVLDGEEVVMYMAGDTHRDWEERVKSIPEQKEMSEERDASQVFHSKQQERSKDDEEDDEGSVSVPPVAIHKVEGGETHEVSDDVEKVLDELWNEE